MTLLLGAGTIQSCRRAQEGLSATRSFSSSHFMLIHKQKCRRNPVSTIFQLFKPWEPRGNPLNPWSSKFFFSKIQWGFKVKEPEHSSQKIYTNLHCLALIRIQKTNKQKPWIRFPQSICACFSLSWIRSWRHFHLCFGRLPASESEPLSFPAVLFLNWMFSGEPQQMPPCLLQQQHMSFQGRGKKKQSISTTLLPLP